ncbi:AraC family transcriptional regulator [Sinosporangium siamense]|uniref:AraC family transcriptional regulator n=1 Tax=Sinosporangium siamense TaxID=1367973 RepID=A0A919RMF2_9ACTN|nr:AraC family transcriptional regulator [Sinosporangium siamense]GII96472.1 AraC family transcriptional regulator [Sinosporangium siamense]
MRIVYEHLEPEFPVNWRYTRFQTPRLEPYWHFHHEYELTCILNGTGTRLAGNSVEEYGPGDLSLFGPDLPHTYVSAPESEPIDAIVVHFTRDFLGAEFFDAPVFGNVKRMLDDAPRGIHFPDAVPLLADLGRLAPPERTVELLRILVMLSRAPYILLATGRSPSVLHHGTALRIQAMMKVIHSGYTARLPLEDIAGAAHMNASAASRLFARSTGFTVSHYVNLVRVNRACQLLRDTDRSVSMVAADSGFGNLSNFNRRFRELKKMSPREYRANFRVELEAVAGASPRGVRV